MLVRTSGVLTARPSQQVQPVHHWRGGFRMCSSEQEAFYVVFVATSISVSVFDEGVRQGFRGRHGHVRVRPDPDRQQGQEDHYVVEVLWLEVQDGGFPLQEGEDVQVLQGPRFPNQAPSRPRCLPAPLSPSSELLLLHVAQDWVDFDGK